MSKSLGEADTSTDGGGKEVTHSCMDCGRVYETPSGLQYHYRTENNDCTGYECPECGKSDYTTKRGLQMHRGREHDATGSYYPKLADESWFREQYLENGLSTADIAEKIGCSRPQASAWKRKHGIESKSEYKSRGSGSDNPTYNRVTTSCDLCNSDIDVPESRIEDGRNNFCDRDCFHAWLENQTGENHPLYDPAYSKQYGPDWQEKRETVRERDNYQCQACGLEESEHHRELVVHHIKPRSDFVTNGVYNHIEGNKLSNLVTLCDYCHQKWEGIPLRPSLL